MDNNDIMKAFESENQKRNDHSEYNHRVLRSSDKFGGNIGALLCIVLALAKLIFVKQIDCGLLAVMLCVRGIQNVIEGKNLSGKKYRLIIGIILLVLCAILTIYYVGGLFA